MRWVASAIILAALLTSAHPASSDETGAVAVYEAEWFAEFRPANAWDMAQRVPGFAVQDGEAVRGFAGASGNVVINGRRPSNKAEALELALRRIPADQVARMELRPGAEFGADLQEWPLVLNVVLSRGESSTSGSAEVYLQHVYTGDVGGGVNVSSLMRRGAHAFNLSFRYDNRRNSDDGYDEFSLPGGPLIERKWKTNEYDRQEASLSADWALTGGDGSTYRINGRLFGWRQPLTHNALVNRPDLSGDFQPIRRDAIDQDFSFSGAEAGGDLSRPVGGGTLRWVGLVRREQYLGPEASYRRTLGGALLDGVAQEVDNRSLEAVGRASWAHTDLFGGAFEAGGELAFNGLDSAVDLFLINSSGTRTPVPLPAADVTVEELRGEAFVSGGRRLSPRLTAEWRLAAETSTLTVSGGASAERTLTFFKPRAALEWRPNDLWRTRVAVERQVSQLNFDDFVTVAEIANDRVSTGNAEIEPERTWRLSLMGERRLFEQGSIRATLNLDHVQRVVDRVPLGPGQDAPGNLGDGRRIGLDVQAGVPLGPLGIPGGRFDLRWLVQDSDVTDPYTGLDRYFSSEVPWFLTAQFRQDLAGGDWAWGVDYIADGANESYRRNEIDRFDTDNYNFGAFVERRLGRITVNFSVDNMFNRPMERRRRFYDPDRSTPDPFLREDRARWQGRTYWLSLKRTFG
ncbi:hypothetical protein Q0812_07490 [Brevundimonas sp. 2R-24]|uniref:TonB-dependent receptor n=1 Tax=Peiella sedimenti TaxID=3061083 RepID=A0ABT8SNU0_9CAUL|nr:hypothetical protein [Caulobacteraceae bacterium XZ-24]